MAKDGDNDNKPLPKDFDKGMKVGDEGLEDDHIEEDIENDDDVNHKEIINDKLLMHAIDDDVGLPLLGELEGVVVDF